MAFEFSLQAVYHLRKSVEHQQELRLLAANQQVSKVGHLVKQVNERIQGLRVQTDAEMGRGITGAEMQFTINAISTLKEHRQGMERELTRLKNLRDQQQRVFEQARRERETFESLREQHLRRYQQEQLRSEQRQLDELFLLRQSYTRRG